MQPSVDLQQAKRLHQRGDLAAAEAAYRAILDGDPGQFDALHLLGVLRQQQGRSAEAIRLLGLAHRAHPAHPACLNNFANALHGAGRHEEAADLYAKAAAVMPGNAGLFVNHASALAALGRPAESLARCDEAIALQPDLPRAHTLRGNALYALERFEEALSAYDRSIALDPGSAEAHRHRGIACHALARDADAAASLRRATALRADDASAHCKLGEVLLRTGKYEEGWREYEWRWKLPDRVADGARFRAPRWDGSQALAGKTLLLASEQGMGDTLMAVRYVPLVASKGARVVLEVQPRLKPLLASLEGAVQVVAQGEALPAHDLHCPLFSLPAAFASTLENLPAELPYVRPPEASVVRWRRYLEPVRGLRAAIVWSGNAAYSADRVRSMPPEAVQPLFAVPGITWYALQKDVSEAAAVVLSRHQNVVRFGAELGDFAEIAAFVANLDLVVTVDTSFAHVAGALGRPLWLMLSHSPHWPWMLEREDSAWYPSARLFRQAAPGAWGPAVQRAAAALRGLLQ